MLESGPHLSVHGVPVGLQGGNQLLSTRQPELVNLEKNRGAIISAHEGALIEKVKIVFTKWRQRKRAMLSNESLT